MRTNDAARATTQGMPGIPADQTENVRPTDQAVADAMRELENEVHELWHMAHILGDKLDDSLREFVKGQGWVSMPPENGHLTVKLSYNELERLSFLWNHVINRSNSLRANYLQAFDGKIGGAA